MTKVGVCWSFLHFCYIHFLPKLCFWSLLQNSNPFIEDSYALLSRLPCCRPIVPAETSAHCKARRCHGPSWRRRSTRFLGSMGVRRKSEPTWLSFGEEGRGLWPDVYSVNWYLTGFSSVSWKLESFFVTCPGSREQGFTNCHSLGVKCHLSGWFIASSEAMCPL